MFELSEITPRVQALRQRYFFYEAVVRCCDAVILFSKRYAAECRAQAGAAVGKRREECSRWPK
jgi:hypothetical protein